MINPRNSTRFELIVLAAVNRLAQLDGLNTHEIALRCHITGTIPTAPAFSREVVSAYAMLEAEQTRGIPQAREEVIS
jgi:hypothetical protein